MNLNVNNHHGDLEMLMGDDRIAVQKVGVDVLIDKPTFPQRTAIHPNPLNQDESSCQYS